MEIAAHTSPCSKVPMTAWYAPPPATDAVMPACECVHHTLDVIALNPLAITEYSTKTKGVRAIHHRQRHQHRRDVVRDSATPAELPRTSAA